MGLFDILKKKFVVKNIEFIDETEQFDIPKTNLKCH